MIRAIVSLSALALCLPALANTTLLTGSGAPLFRTDYASVPVLYNNSGLRAGATNASGRIMLTTSSNPVAALQAAANAWSAVDGARIRFAPLSPTALENDTQDLINVAILKDSPEIRSIVGDSLAVTLIIALPSTGEILDADILFSPSTADAGTPFSTNGAPNTYDLQSTATHELGHLLGAGHSHLLSATMFPFSGDLVTRTLSPDDAAFARFAAPAATAQNLGQLRGTLIQLNGQPARGIAVTASDSTTGITVGAISNTNGAYSIGSLPLGSYVVFAAPLDGIAEPSNFRIAPGDADLNLNPAYFASKRPVQILSGAPADASFTLPPRTGNPTITFLAGGQADSAGDFSKPGPFEAIAGDSFDILLAGRGLDATVTASDIDLLGANLTIRPGSVRLDSLLSFQDGSRVLRFTVDAADSTRRSIVSLIIRHAGGIRTIPGFFVVAPTQGQILGVTSSSIVNAATGTAGPVAPNSWVSLFAQNLAREFILGPASLGTQIDGTSVLITDSRGFGQLARLQFVSPQQINFLVPAFVAPGTARLTVTSLLGRGSANFQVQAIAPGIFAANSNGQGPAASTFLTVLPSTGQQSGLTFRADTNPRANLPIDLGPPGSQVYLIFYGTGLRAHLTPVTATIGSLSVPVLAAGDQLQFAGLDQINVGPLPASLAGRGNVNVIFQVDGRPTNTVTVNIK
jgi:uncharacterized protein (TIGR03437 family)